MGFILLSLSLLYLIIDIIPNMLWTMKYSHFVHLDGLKCNYLLINQTESKDSSLYLMEDLLPCDFSVSPAYFNVLHYSY